MFAFARICVSVCFVYEREGERGRKRVAVRVAQSWCIEEVSKDFYLGLLFWILNLHSC